MQIFDTWLKGAIEGFVAFPIVYYVVKNFGSVLVTDATNMIKKITGSSTPVTNG